MKTIPDRDRNPRNFPNKETVTEGAEKKLEKVKKREQHCGRCRNHGRCEKLKNHKLWCPYKLCVCEKCLLLLERRSVMARQVALRRRQDSEAQRIQELTASGLLSSSTSPTFLSGVDETKAEVLESQTEASKDSDTKESILQASSTYPSSIRGPTSSSINFSRSSDHIRRLPSISLPLSAPIRGHPFNLQHQLNSISTPSLSIHTLPSPDSRNINQSEFSSHLRNQLLLSSQRSTHSIQPQQQRASSTRFQELVQVYSYLYSSILNANQSNPGTENSSALNGLSRSNNLFCDYSAIDDSDDAKTTENSKMSSIK
ncbi:uncharacterized protein LOC142338039 [Convolutriloba macropyga]|uniref:uncharacterized protein LOC142338039 n=1 Tax=Convolutriloba macropyga TaxID=536237 RepID=UPI003F523A41